MGVTTVLEGSIRRSGNRLRVTAQLITASDGSHLWSERYDREMADLFVIQDEIAQAISAALHLKLVGIEPRSHQPKLSAYNTFLRGRHQLFRNNTEASLRARDCFEEAAREDPQFAAPHAELGLLYFLMALTGVRPLAEMTPAIRQEARKALQLNPGEAGPEFLLGIVAVAQDYDWTGAANHFRRALSGPSVLADARWAYASLYLEALGRFSESIAEMEKVVEQDPLNAMWRAVLAAHLNQAEQYDRALEEFRRALELDESLWTSHCHLAEAYIGLGRYKEAVAAAERAHQCAPWNSMPIAFLAAALHRLGEASRAAHWLLQIEDAPKPIWGRVVYHLLCLETEAAAEWYERSLQQREAFAVIYAHAPYGRGLRASSHWPHLARIMNLPDSSR